MASSVIVTTATAAAATVVAAAAAADTATTATAAASTASTASDGSAAAATTTTAAAAAAQQISLHLKVSKAHLDPALHEQWRCELLHDLDHLRLKVVELHSLDYFEAVEDAVSSLVEGRVENLCPADVAATST